MTPTLLAFEDSVYSWCAKAGLAAKGVEYAYEELNPFDAEGQGQLAGRHPFGRVPVLGCGGFIVYETLAILTYVDQAFEGPSLMPREAKAQARALQVAEMAGAYVYWPCVRQVFSHGVYRPLKREAHNSADTEAGLKAAQPVLGALGGIAQEGLVLNAASLSIADFMLAPMLHYFVAAPQGAVMIQDYPALRNWLNWTAQQPAFATTRPKILDEAGEYQ